TEVFTFADTNDVANVTSAACAASDVIYIPTDNTAASCAETINNVALPAKTPIISGEENACKGFGVATLSISYYDIGYIAGEMAYEILVNGANPGEMEIRYAPEVIKKYNAEICSELGITPAADYVAIG
ncbi:MAG: ABC transporter substrate-binding protein, partial [Oscillospiraceae bacterium]|nr:ABC transporter substrate-binding protein [Oscillospiraceae bacterium]